MQTGIYWGLEGHLEVLVEHHHALYRCVRIARSIFGIVEISNSKLLQFLFLFLEASYEIYEKLHHSKISRYTVTV